MWAKKWGLRLQWGARSSCTQVFENIIQKFICIYKGSGDDIEGILALGGGAKKCKPKDDVSGADALAAALGSDTCDMDGMDEKVNKYLPKSCNCSSYNLNNWNYLWIMIS